MTISRRTIIVSGLTAGAGLAVWSVARYLDDGDARARFAATTPGSTALNAWVKIDAHGGVICGVHRAEMGQGVSTALPMLIAEELDVEWAQVRFEFTPVDRDYFNFGVMQRGQPLGDTEGRPLAALGERLVRGGFHALGLSMTISSSSVVDAWDSVREAAATARALLVAAAAERFGVAPEALQTARGEVFDPASGRRAGYGELAAAAARLRLDTVARPKPLDRLRLLGTSPPRLDIPAKITGSALFGSDIRRPDMLFATVRHSPLTGTRIAAIDNLSEVASLPGVAGVVRLGRHAVAVVARDTWTALRAAARLSLLAEPVDSVAPDTGAVLDAWRAALDGTDAVVLREQGDAPAALAQAATVVAADYELPFLAHLCMEPMSCTALVEAGAVTVWAPTQAPSLARDTAAQVAGVAADAVTVHSTYLGGGFGRRAEMDFVAHAVGVAAQFPGRPVSLVYSREEDVRADMYRPAAVARVRAALAPAGRLQALDYTLVSQSVTASYFTRTPTPRGGNARKDKSALSGAIELVYPSVPALRFAFAARDPGIPAGFWRSVGNSHNAFIVESFMDELAAAAGQDPVAFRLAHLEGRPAHQAVLREVAARAGWATPLPPGHGRGVALVESHDSIVAQVLEVAVAPGAPLDTLRVARVVCVIDPRIAIHPDGIAAQMEGAIIDGLSAALFGQVSVRGGDIEQRNFDDCRWLRMDQVPRVEVHLLPQGGRPGGVGEPGLPPVAPALANAICAATGQRIRRLPVLQSRPGGG
jgi:isoquinoline 1-oxidoreductase beta subunit